MTHGSRTQRLPCTPDRAGWWGRLFVALLFAFYTCFIPIHLATETHLDGLLGLVVDADHHHDGHDNGDHDADSDHHTPHRASDHTLTLTTAAKTPSVTALAVFFLPALTSDFISEPEPQLPAPVFENIRAPDDPPPDPRQPRAPPLA